MMALAMLPPPMKAMGDAKEEEVLLMEAWKVGDADGAGYQKSAAARGARCEAR
jgi:hypothetical protein